MIKFTVLGRPQPAGSKRAFPIRKQGALTGRVAVSDSNPLARAWKQEVASIAAQQATTPDGFVLWDAPVILSVEFHLARSKSHYGTGRNAGIVKPSAPHHPMTRPDLTKLLRGLEDALTGVLYRDDSQVVRQIVDKFYGTPERTEVRVHTMTGRGPK